MPTRSSGFRDMGATASALRCNADARAPGSVRVAEPLVRPASASADKSTDNDDDDLLLDNVSTQTHPRSPRNTKRKAYRAPVRRSRRRAAPVTGSARKPSTSALPHFGTATRLYYPNPGRV